MELLIGNLRQAGETCGNRLERAVKVAWAEYTQLSKAEECAWSDHAATAYWPQAEIEFWSRLDRHDFTGYWRSFQKIAEGIYTDITTQGGLNSRAHKASARSRIWLYGGPVKKKKANDKTKAGSSQLTMKPYLSPDLEEPKKFVEQISQVCESPAARATLRRALKRLPNQAPETTKYVVPYLPKYYRAYKNAGLAIAAMMATYGVPRSPNSGVTGNLGQILAVAVNSGELRETTADTRLTHLVRKDQVALIEQLPGTVQLVAEQMSLTSWAQLLNDIRRWELHSRDVGHRWLDSFWRQRTALSVHDAAQHDLETNQQQ